MPVAVCPHCRAELDLDAEDVGALVECPACNRTFTADPPPPTPPADVPPWQRPREREPGCSRRTLADRDLDSPQEQIDYAKSECESPGNGLRVIGMLTVVSGLFEVVMVAGRFDGNSGTLQMLGYGVYSVLTGAFWVYAGVQMQAVKQYGVCLIGCVSVIIPGVSPCCMLGVIFGLMGVSKLNDRRVKLGFAANRPDLDPDAGV